MGAIKLQEFFLVFVFAFFLLGFNAQATDKIAKATFAGGCFWCMEPPFESLYGVKDVVSGYTGGTGQSPNYKNYAAKGHIEAVEITYDPSIISYEQLLDVFWMQIDPTDSGGQFVDRGFQYTSAIFYHNDQQKNLALQSRGELSRSDRFSKPIVTPIRPATKFYPAEGYHQDYYKTHSRRYKYYRSRSGRDQFLDKIWGNNRKGKKMSKEELRKKLSPIQYKVTQENGTEPPFENKYWDNTRAGIYVDILSGEPLFSSKDKYKSGTGWPSFTKPLEEDNIVLKEDRFLIFQVRTEVRSKHGDNHLGHLFDDGPQPTGKRYCMNSAALKFIPKEDLKKEGYGRYLNLFD